MDPNQSPDLSQLDPQTAANIMAMIQNGGQSQASATSPTPNPTSQPTSRPAFAEQKIAGGPGFFGRLGSAMLGHPVDQYTAPQSTANLAGPVSTMEDYLGFPKGSLTGISSQKDAQGNPIVSEQDYGKLQPMIDTMIKAKALGVNKNMSHPIYSTADQLTAQGISPEDAPKLLMAYGGNVPDVVVKNLNAAKGTAIKGQGVAQTGASQTESKLQTAQNQYNNEVKKEQEALDAVKTARDQIAASSSNPVAFSSVPITLARMMTGTSRINVQEINRLGGSQAVLARLQQMGTTMAQGTITPQNQQFMSQLADILENSHNTNIQALTQKHVGQWQQVSGKQLPHAYQDITGSPMPQQQPQQPTQPAQGQTTGMIHTYPSGRKAIYKPGQGWVPYNGQ